VPVCANSFLVSLRRRFLARVSRVLRHRPSYISAADVSVVDSLLDVAADGVADHSERRRQLANIITGVIVVVVVVRYGDSHEQWLDLAGVMSRSRRRVNVVGGV